MNNVHLPVANRRRKHGGEGKVAPLDFWLKGGIFENNFFG